MLHNHPIRHEALVIFAIDGGEDDIAGARKRLWFETCMREAGTGFKAVAGCYKGKLERSYVMTVENYALITGWTKGQESVLFLSPVRENGQREAKLLDYRDNDIIPLGIWRAVSEAEAHKYDGWTFDPAEGQHYVAG
jgi:hypothetical protein